MAAILARFCMKTDNDNRFADSKKQYKPGFKIFWKKIMGHMGKKLKDPIIIFQAIALPRIFSNH